MWDANYNYIIMIMGIATVKSTAKKAVAIVVDNLCETDGQQHMNTLYKTPHPI